MRAYEFYTRPDGEVEVCKENTPCFQLAEIQRDFIVKMIIILRDEYPEAFKALSTLYHSSIHDRFYYDFLIVRRFIKCNWSQFDNQPDVDKEGSFRFEYCACPMRGECKYFRIICQPKRESKISDAERRVLRLIVRGLKTSEIADTLRISIFTVDNHRKNMLRKLKFSKITQLVDYWHNNKLE